MSTAPKPGDDGAPGRLPDLGVALGISYGVVVVIGLTIALAVGHTWEAVPILLLVAFSSYLGPAAGPVALVYDLFATEPVTTFGSLWHVVPAIMVFGGVFYKGRKLATRSFRLLLLTAAATAWALYGFYCLALVGALDA